MAQTMTSTSLLDQINALKTPAKQLLRNLYNEWCECLEIPNSLLPARLHGRVGRTVKEILHPKLTPEQIRKQEAEDREIEKELRLESYCADTSAQREIRFHEDEERLYRNQITFAKLLELEFDE